MRLIKEPINDEFYIKVSCDKCGKKLAKYLEGNGFIIEENLNTLCNQCFEKVKL